MNRAVERAIVGGLTGTTSAMRVTHDAVFRAPGQTDNPTALLLICGLARMRQLLPLLPTTVSDGHRVSY